MGIYGADHEAREDQGPDAICFWEREENRAGDFGGSDGVHEPSRIAPPPKRFELPAGAGELEGAHRENEQGGRDS